MQHSKISKKKTLSHIKGGRTRIDTSKVREQGEMEEFASALEESFPGPPDTNACNRREHLKNAALPCSFSARKTNKTADWFESHPKEMTPVTAEKRGALAAIFFFLNLLFCFVFFSFIIFFICLVSFTLTADPIQLREVFPITYF